MNVSWQTRSNKSYILQKKKKKKKEDEMILEGEEQPPPHTQKKKQTKNRVNEDETNKETNKYAVNERNSNFIFMITFPTTWNKSEKISSNSKLRIWRGSFYEK